jgi:hypothetical protein
MEPARIMPAFGATLPSRASQRRSADRTDSRRSAAAAGTGQSAPLRTFAAGRETDSVGWKAVGPKKGVDEDHHSIAASAAGDGATPSIWRTLTPSAAAVKGLRISSMPVSSRPSWTMAPRVYPVV